jgi:hypothetical protein
VSRPFLPVYFNQSLYLASHGEDPGGVETARAIAEALRTHCLMGTPFPGDASADPDENDIDDDRRPEKSPELRAKPTTVMCVGHNYGWEELALALCGGGKHVKGGKIKLR